MITLIGWAAAACLTVWGSLIASSALYLQWIRWAGRRAQKRRQAEAEREANRRWLNIGR